MPIHAVLERNADDFVDGLKVEFATSIQFPIEAEQLREKLDKMWLTQDNIDQFAITQIDFSHDEQTAEIDNHFPESINLISIDKLNHLAVLLDGLSNNDQLKAFTLFDYAANADNFTYECEGLDDMIDLVNNIRLFAFYEDVNDYAKEFMGAQDGMFVDWGYMGWGGEYEPDFLDNGVPDENRVWEQAAESLLPEKFTHPVPKVDYEAVNNGRVENPALRTAREICGHAWGGQDPELFGGEREKARQIIEIADSLENDPGFFPKWLTDSIRPGRGMDTAARIDRELKDYADEAMMEVQIERDVAPSTVDPHSAMLPSPKCFLYDSQP